MDLFISKLFVPEERFFYFAWVLIVMISIVLHELGHGWMAIRCGDDTPLRLKRMTGNPLVHMGPVSLFFLFVIGITWGMMPVDPTRFRGKYAEAKVAAAGPAVNVALMVVSVIVLVVLVRLELMPGDEEMAGRLFTFLYLAALTNGLLLVLNLMPVPPLDGSRILANFHRGYRDLLHRQDLQGMWLLGMLFAFGVMWQLMPRIAGGLGQVIDYMIG